ncbi:MAG TPA: efflux RND transporter periplasmic adaptor subunit [Syntrophomonadaceae bacterium]|nr:efflux RND transporter periplasmic adaptor subunit [Syntrophomonadaceae bacterium]
MFLLPQILHLLLKVKLESDQANARLAQATLDDALAKSESTQKASGNIYLAQIEQAQAAYDNAKLAEDNTVILAPVSGIILCIPVVVGENVSAGQTLLTISDHSNTWITANIDEDKFGRIKVGEKAKVEVDAYPGQSFAGEVIETGNATQSTFSLISTENTSGNYTKVTGPVR